MSLWDYVSDLEFDNTALAITAIISVLFLGFFFGDPLNVGMDKISWVARLIGWLAGTVVGYVIAVNKLNG